MSEEVQKEILCTRCGAMDTVNVTIDGDMLNVPVHKKTCVWLRAINKVVIDDASEGEDETPPNDSETTPEEDKKEDEGEGEIETVREGIAS